MKKYYNIFLVIFLVSLVLSCNHKQQRTRDEQINDFRKTLISEDTVTMLKLADEAMEMLKAKKIDQVVASLYEYNDSTKEVKALSESTAKRYHHIFHSFPVLDYSREYYSFMLEGCNDVQYTVIFATAEQTGTDQPGTTHFMFNPVKIDGEWKLCVKTANDQIDKEKN